MKIVTFTIRTLIGIALLLIAVSYFLNLMPEPVTDASFKVFNVGALSADYIMPIAKFVTLLCGLSFITDRYVTLASILILPLILNILFLDYYLRPQALPISVFLFLGNTFIMYKHWKNYKRLFAAK